MSMAGIPLSVVVGHTVPAWLRMRTSGVAKQVIVAASSGLLLCGVGPVCVSDHTQQDDESGWDDVPCHCRACYGALARGLWQVMAWAHAHACILHHCQSMLMILYC